MKNFAFPYFSRDIAEFWRRWHISLSTWFRDYLYIPIGGSKGGKFMQIRNTFFIFIVSGFWHGANWTFIVWGALNSLYFLPLLLRNKNRINLDIVAMNKVLPTFVEFIQILFTFSITVLAWIFFRAETVSHALLYLSNMFTNIASFFSIAIYFQYKFYIVMILIFIVIEWLGRQQEYALATIKTISNPIYRYTFYYLIVLTLFWFAGKEQQFIYFQF